MVAMTGGEGRGGSKSYSSVSDVRETTQPAEHGSPTALHLQVHQAVYSSQRNKFEMS